ncbi:MATE family efflux transporter [Altererythrobacter sp. GH1-8]|uniref:MATE family efflux transporter n=1 Tax=Altererythrobacter sp. GH1-8 TaxID=3349333 RepID=UPI00374DBBCD
MRETVPLLTPTWGEEIRATFKLAWPLALANLLQMLTYAIDVMFIARLGDEELAASSLTVSWFGLLLWALMSMNGAMAAVLAAKLGENPKAVRPIRRTTRMGLWLAVFSGLAAMVLAGGLLVPIMKVTGQQSDIIALADGYNSVLIFSMIPMIFASVLRNYVSALGRPYVATAITGLGIIVNGVANYAFVFGNFGMPRLELVGAAIATIITSVIVVLAYVALIRWDRLLHRYRIFANWWRADWPVFWQIVKIGSPIALTVTAEAGIFGAAAFMMGRFGAAELAGHTVALQLAALAFQVPQGVGQATTIRVGYFFGARDRQGIKQAGWVAIAMGAGFMTITALLMLLTPELLLSIYVDVDAARNAALIGFALQYLMLAAVFQLADGVQAVAAGVLRGLQDTRVPMWIAIFSYWVPGMGLAIGLGFFTILAGVGVWVGLAAGLFSAAILLTWRWMLRDRIGLTMRI